LTVLEHLLQDTTAGDPMSGLKWTYKSTRKISKHLRRLGFRVGRGTVARLLRKLKFSLRTNRKRLAGTHHPDRDRQFRYIARLRRLFLKNGDPVISVDAKKKEWIGHFKNPGRGWRRAPREVMDHDFAQLSQGPGIPYGIYDEAYNDGYAVIGRSRETATFAVGAIRRWWIIVGQKRYPGKKHLLIHADGGGANGSRRWAWKAALQEFADEFGLTITVTHYPPGASKWNPIERKMFSPISANWAGEPLVSYETMLKFIRRTKTSKGFHCKAYLDKQWYEADVKKKIDRAAIQLKPRKVLPKWNYTISPRVDTKKRT
jgi:Rhodopirellula transposase DDE domain